MKASKFFVVFETDITYWEKTLSHISETVEMILQVCSSMQCRGHLC
jgi:dynein heavy chain